MEAVLNHCPYSQYVQLNSWKSIKRFWHSSMFLNLNPKVGRCVDKRHPYFTPMVCKMFPEKSPLINNLHATFWFKWVTIVFMQIGTPTFVIISHTLCCGLCQTPFCNLENIISVMVVLSADSPPLQIEDEQ